MEKNIMLFGRLGMYHSIIDITEGNDIYVGNKVLIEISPIYVNSDIRREYI